jgi:transposase
MTDVVDVNTRQRMVTELLTAEGSSPIEVHRRLRSVYGEDAVEISSVRRWIRRFNSGEKDVGDNPSAIDKLGRDDGDKRQG